MTQISIYVKMAGKREPADIPARMQRLLAPYYILGRILTHLVDLIDEVDSSLLGAEFLYALNKVVYVLVYQEFENSDRVGAIGRESFRATL